MSLNENRVFVFSFELYELDDNLLVKYCKVLRDSSKENLYNDKQQTWTEGHATYSFLEKSTLNEIDLCMRRTLALLRSLAFGRKV